MPHLLAKRSGNNKKSILISLYKFAYIVWQLLIALVEWIGSPLHD